MIRLLYRREAVEDLAILRWSRIVPAPARWFVSAVSSIW